MESYILDELTSHKQTIQDTINSLQEDIKKACMLAVDTLKNGNKILIFGNGGSAADAQHIAAELTGRYKVERKGLPAIALTTDTSALSAIANDYGYDQVFSRQVEALANRDDLLLAISTSGNSQNVVNALEVGKQIACNSIAFTGKGGGVMQQMCDVNIIIPSSNTPRIQEMHILIGHIICGAIDNHKDNINGL
jgi:D-sedoheptulose 7-phosphate isomerase